MPAGPSRPFVPGVIDDQSRLSSNSRHAVSKIESRSKHSRRLGVRNALRGFGGVGAGGAGHHARH